MAVLSGTNIGKGRFGVDLTGDRELIALLNQLPAKVERRVMRGAITKVARRMVTSVKAAVEHVGAVDSGALQKSIGFKVRTAKGGGIVAFIGPKSDYKQAVDPNKKTRKGKTVRLSKKKAAAAEESGRKVVYRQPARYAHLVELGIDDTAPKPFMRVGFESYQDVAIATIRHDVLEGIEREAKKMAATGKR